MKHFLFISLLIFVMPLHAKDFQKVKIWNQQAYSPAPAYQNYGYYPYQNSTHWNNAPGTYTQPLFKRFKGKNKSSRHLYRINPYAIPRIPPAPVAPVDSGQDPSISYPGAKYEPSYAPYY